MGIQARTHQRTRPDPWGKCFPSRSQGLTFTRELQPNGLHPFHNGIETQAPPSPTAARFATVQANSEEERHQWTTLLRILLQRTRGLSPSTASAVTTGSRSTTENEVPKVASSPSSHGSNNSL